MTDNKMPTDAFIVDADGIPTSHVDFDRLTTDATLLMYELAETAGDDDATDRVAIDWASRFDPDYFGYVAAAALSLTVRNILAPALDAAAAVGLNLRSGLKRATADAKRDLA